MALLARLDMGIGSPNLTVVSTHTENNRLKGWREYNARSMSSVASALSTTELSVFGGDIPIPVSNKRRHTDTLDILHAEAGFATADESNEEKAFEHGASGDWLMTKGFAGTDSINSSEKARVISSGRLSDHNFVTAALVLRPESGDLGHDATSEFPVDVVYTWAAEPSAKMWNEYTAFCTARIKTPGGMGKHAPYHLRGRFRDWGTLEYSLRSVRRYLPWVRRVFLLTNGDGLPSFLGDAQTAAAAGVTLITHKDIWPTDRVEADLPTFNSDAIESHLHRIPGLAERFIYVQDDMFVGRALSRAAFFGDGGEPILQQPVDIHAMAGHLVRAFTKSCFKSVWASGGREMVRVSHARCRGEYRYTPPLQRLLQCRDFRSPSESMMLSQAYISRLCNTGEPAGHYGCVPKNYSALDIRTMISGKSIVVLNDAYTFRTLEDEEHRKTLMTEMMNAEWPMHPPVPLLT